jgi:hypothetical protein
MKRKFALFAWALTLSMNAGATVPPPEQLLPAGTVAVLTLPDVTRARAACATNATGQFWSDPAMRPFREHLVGAIDRQLIAPLERELGVKLADYDGLLRGQLTLAWVQTDHSNQVSTGWLLLADAREKSNDLGLQLDALRKKWAAVNPSLRTEKIQDVEFATLVLSNAGPAGVLQRALAAPGLAAPDSTNTAPVTPPTGGDSIEPWIGQSGSLLIVGTDTNVIQGILSRQEGGGGSRLHDNPVFRKEHQAGFEDALAYGWVNLQPLTDLVVRWASAQDSQTRDEDPKRPMPKRSKLLAATGLTGAQTLSFAWHQGQEGSLVEWSLGAPATNRSGLFKLLEFEPRESGPPPFVPVDAITFQRYRLSLPKAWTALEQMFVDVFPPARSVLNFLLQTAGKDTDANYDLKAELLSNLGDDVVSYELVPRTNAPPDLRSPSSLSLVGSTNADRLATALKAAAGLFMSASERIVLGRKLYSFSLPATATPDASAARSSSLGFVAVTTNFVAISTDTNLLESWLSTTNTAAQPLNDLPGLTQAAQRVGGWHTGWLDYENTAARARATFDSLKQHPDSALTLVPPAYLLVITGLKLEEPLQRTLAECDFTLLPSFDTVAKYFHFAVSAGSVEAEGFRYRTFSPVPPALLAKPTEPPPVQSPSK